MSYNIKLYKNTMFDAVNVPDSYELLDNGEFEYDEFEDVNLVQGRYLTQVTLTYEPDAANKVDYVVLVNNSNSDKTAYTVDHYEMQAENICTFWLLLEPYLTMGGIAKQNDDGTSEPGVVVLGGTVQRMHVPLVTGGACSQVTGSDADTFYMGDEPFVPQRHPDFEVQQLLDVSGNTTTLLETLSIPSKLVTDSKAVLKGQSVTSNTGQTRESSTTGATIISDEDASNTLATLQYTERNQPRQLASSKLMFGTQAVDLGTRWWTESSRYYSGISYIGLDGQTHTASGDVVSDLIMDGRFSDVSGYWEIPAVFITTIYEQGYAPDKDAYYGGISIIKSDVKSVSISTKQFGYKPYNNKCYYGQSNVIKVFNPVSGDVTEREVQDLLSPSAKPSSLGSISGYIGADIRPTGQPFFGFKYLYGADNQTTPMEVVNGGNWRHKNLTNTGTLSGGNVQYMQLAQAQQNAAHNNEYIRNNANWQIATGVGTALSGVVAAANGQGAYGASAITGGISTVVNASTQAEQQIWQNNKSVADQEAILNQQAVSASVTLKTTALNYFCDIGKNTFYAVSSHYDDTDMELLDIFYERFGYNVGTIRAANYCFWTRPKFNFVQSTDIQLLAPEASINVINDVKARLKTGLRVWHVKPSVQLTLPGCNR